MCRRWLSVGSWSCILLGSVAGAEEVSILHAASFPTTVSTPSSLVGMPQKEKLEDPEGWSRFGATSLVTLGLQVGISESQQQDSLAPGGLGGVQLQLQMPLWSCGTSVCSGPSVDLRLGFGSPDVRVWLRAEPLSVFIKSPRSFISSGQVSSAKAVEATDFTRKGWFWTPLAVDMMITGGGRSLDATRMGNSHIFGSSRWGYSHYQGRYDGIHWLVEGVLGMEGGYVKDPEVGAGWLGGLLGLRGAIHLPVRGPHGFVGRAHAELHFNGLGSRQSVGQATNGLVAYVELFYRRRLRSTAAHLGMSTNIDWFNVVFWPSDSMRHSDQSPGLGVYGGPFFRVEGL